MAYQTLYLKYRSQKFGELVGQDAIAQTLKNAVGQSRVAHAYLFSGVRGTGKTSTARILAKAINCLNLQGARPCVDRTAQNSVDGGVPLPAVRLPPDRNRSDRGQVGDDRRSGAGQGGPPEPGAAGPTRARLDARRYHAARSVDLAGRRRADRAKDTRVAGVGRPRYSGAAAGVHHGGRCGLNPGTAADVLRRRR